VKILTYRFKSKKIISLINFADTLKNVWQDQQCGTAATSAPGCVWVFLKLECFLALPKVYERLILNIASCL